MSRFTLVLLASFIFSHSFAQDTFNGMISTFGDQDFDGMNGVMEVQHNESLESDASFNGVMTLFEPQPVGLEGEMNGVMDAFSVSADESVRIFKNQRNDLLPALKVQSFFAINSFHLSVDAIENLQKILPALKSDGIRNISIFGYADATGPVSYNQWLSEKRAESVRKWLISNGVQAKLIQVKGFGAQDHEPQDAATWRRSDLMVEIK